MTSDCFRITAKDGALEIFYVAAANLAEAAEEISKHLGEDARVCSIEKLPGLFVYTQ